MVHYSLFHCLQMILPTCLRDHVPAVHQSLLKLVYALRRLEGQVVSQHEAESLGVMPGSPLVARRSLVAVHKDLVRGLIMFEGSLPACHLNPLLHRMVHYAPQTAAWGSLQWFAMWSFERFNKHIKNMCRNNKWPMQSIAHSMEFQVATKFFDLSDPSANQPTPITTMSFSSRCFLVGAHPKLHT